MSINDDALDVWHEGAGAGLELHDSNLPIRGRLADSLLVESPVTPGCWKRTSMWSGTRDTAFTRSNTLAVNITRRRR